MAIGIPSAIKQGSTPQEEKVKNVVRAKQELQKLRQALVNDAKVHSLRTSRLPKDASDRLIR